MGKKFIIEIDDAYLSMAGHVPALLYRVNGFNSLVFDENGLNKLIPYDESAAELRGAEKAWELAKKISIMPDEAKKEVWGTDKYNTINLGYSYAEAAEKYEAWMKKKNEIKAGDEVWNTNNNVKAVVLEIFGDENDPTAKVYERNIGFNYPPLRALRKVDEEQDENA